MKSHTKATLHNITAGTKSVHIYDDEFLKVGVIVLFDALACAEDSLTHLSITGCKTDVTKDYFLERLGGFKNLRVLDLSKNDGFGVNFSTNLAVSLPKLLSFTCVVNRDYYANKSRLQELLKHDRIPHIILGRCDSDSDGYYELQQYALQSKNIISLMIETNGSYAGIDALEAAMKACEQNKSSATLYYNHLYKSDFMGMVGGEEWNVTPEIIQDFAARIPAIMFIAFTNESYDATCTRLLDFHKRCLKLFGMGIPTEYFDHLLNPKEPEAAPVPAVIERAELPVLSDVLKSMTFPTAEDIGKSLDAAKENPLLIRDIGEECLAANTAISLAALSVNLDRKGLETPAKSMSDFLSKFAEAKSIITAHIEGHRTRRAGLDQQEQRQKLPIWKRLGHDVTSGAQSLISKLKSKGEELAPIAQAARLAKEAGQILQDMVPALTAMEDNVADNRITTGQIVHAYKLVKDQLELTVDMANGKLDLWRASADPQDMIIIDMPTDDGDQADNMTILPPHIDMLEGRTDLLRQSTLQVYGFMAGHAVQAQRDQILLTGCGSLKSIHIPQLANAVTTFLGQIGTLERVAVIQAVSDVTKVATATEGDTTVAAAMMTIDAITDLGKSTQDAIDQMRASAEYAQEQFAIRSGLDEKYRAAKKPGANPAQGSKPQRVLYGD